MERKSSKEYSVVFLVEGEKFEIRNDFSRNLATFVLFSAETSVGTSLGFAPGGGRRHSTKFSGFFFSTA